MRAGQESYRDGFDPVRKVSREYRDMMKKFDRRMALWQLMNILAKKPAAAVIGELRRSDRKVHFDGKMLWSVVGKEVESDAVSEQAVKSAVGRLRAVLAENGIMYSAWASAPLGNKKNRTKGRAVDITDFTVGLVHIEKPVKLSRYKGKKGVEPGS